MLPANPKLGIVGLGSLGSTMQRYFTEQGRVPFGYDKKGVGSPVEVNRADLVFICVNTPFDSARQESDLSYVTAAVSLLQGNKTVVIRSTVPPGTTDSLQARFPQHHLLFNPEFLRARTAYEDFIKPPRQIIGVTEQSKPEAEVVLALLPQAPAEYTAVLPAAAAELIKYASNVMLATKVAFANKIFEFTQALGVDYAAVKRLISGDSRIGSYGWEVEDRGYRGYNGACFPKDVRSLLVLGKQLGVDVGWLEDMDDENLRLLLAQGQAPDYGYPKQT